MTKQELERWQEIMFFAFCDKIMRAHYRDTRVLFGIVEGLEHMGEYNVHLVKQACMNVLTDMRYKPSKQEVVELGLKVGVNSAGIRAVFRITAKHYYNIKAEPKGILFMPRLPIAQFDAMTKFMKAYIKLKGIYNYDTTRQDGPLGPFQDTWSRRINSESL